MCLLARQIKSAVTDSQGNGEASSSSRSSRLVIPGSSKSLIEGKPTLCSIHWATLSSFQSWRAGAMSCRPMGRPRLDKAVGTETAGRPGVQTERELREAGCSKSQSEQRTPLRLKNTSFISLHVQEGNEKQLLKLLSYRCAWCAYPQHI